MRKISATVIRQGQLTVKESVVLRYVCEGYTRKEIASLIFRTPSTVGKQIESIAQKLECHCAAEIVATAVAAGLVTIKINQEHSLFTRLIAVILMVNVVGGHIDMRRGPRSPRPIRTQRLPSSRLVRNQNRA